VQTEDGETMNTLRDILGKPVLFHCVLYQGKDGLATSPTGYLSTDPNVIGDQLTAMQNLGGEGCGVIALTYGPTVSAFIHKASMEMCAQCNEREMPFALCFDPWTVDGAPKGTTPDAAMIAALKNSDIQTMLNSKTYISSLNGVSGKLVLDFSTGADAKTVQASVPGLNYLMEVADYAWPQIKTTGGPGPVNNNVKLPCVSLQFNDGTGPDRNKSVWNQAKPARIIPANAGAYFWSLAAAINQAAQFVQWVTWNDVLEGTDIESFASVLGGKI
jgi:hypothetical protein